MVARPRDDDSNWVQGELFGEDWTEPRHEQLAFDFDQLELPAPLVASDFEIADAFDDVQDPTSTTNPDRPRTLLAGYNRRSRTMTVMFRDGTVWDYRGVPQLLWSNFMRAYSKGWFLYASGLDRWSDMGPSNLSNLPPVDLEHFMVRAQLAQSRAGGLTPGLSPARSKRYHREDAAIKRKNIRTPDNSRISNPYVERARKRRSI